MWKLARTLRRPSLVAVRGISSVTGPAANISLSKPLPNFELASSEQKPARGRCELSKFDNNLTVGSLETDSPISQLNIVVRAGSRYERPGEVGVSHFLRRMAFKSTDSHSVVYMARMPELCGGSCWNTGGRETITFSAECLLDNSAPMMELLAATVKQPAFHHWEVRDLKPIVVADRAGAFLDQSAELVEALHQAAYRNTLRNSIFCPPHQVEMIDDHAVRAYWSRLFTGPRIAVVGVGIPHKDLVQLTVESGLQELPSSSAEDDKAVFTATNQEVRFENGQESVVGAVVGQGAALTGDQYFASAILQRILGTGVYVQYGCNAATSRITGSSEKARPGGAKVTTLNFNYTDSGLFGVLVSAKRDTIRPCLKAAWDEVSRAAGGVTAQELDRAKAQVKADLLRTLETRSDMTEDIAMQSLLRGRYMPPTNVLELVDNITSAQVSEFAQSVATSTRVLALSGDLRDAPYLNEL